MAITGIRVSECFSYIEDEDKRKLEISIYFSSNNDLKNKGISVYHHDTNLLLAYTGIEKDLQPEFELALDQNVEQFMSTIRKDGFRTYNLRIEEDLANGTIGGVFFSDIQFLDIEPEVTLVELDENDKTANIEIFVKYYSPGVVFTLLNEKHSKEFVFSNFEYDENLELWRGEVLVDKSFATCDEELALSIIGEYLGEELPCQPTWQSRDDLNETLNGVCMNTSWQKNLNIFWDDAKNDSLRDLQMTKESGHLLATYYTPIGSTSNNGLMIRMQNASGALLPPVQMFVLQAKINKDANTTAIDDTDAFAAVWSGNASGTFKIYARTFVANPTGINANQFQEIEISGSNGNYTCPRVIYNPVSKLLLATWVSTTEKKIQGKYLDPKTLEDMSYTFDISTNIYTGYNSSTLDLGTSTTENIVLMNYGENIIIGYLEKVGELKFLRISKPTNGSPTVSFMAPYSQSKMGKFHAVLDEINNNIMLVYVLGQDIYGERIRVFSYESGETYAPIKLNSVSTGSPMYPYINKVKNQQGNHEFHVAWTSSTLGAYFNRFDTNFFSIDAEIRVNEQGSGNMYPKLIASDNEIAMLFQATKFNNVSLKGQGILAFVKSRY